MARFNFGAEDEAPKKRTAGIKTNTPAGKVRATAVEAMIEEDETDEAEQKHAVSLEGVGEVGEDMAFLKQQARVTVALLQQVLSKLQGGPTPPMPKETTVTIKTNGEPARKVTMTEAVKETAGVKQKPLIQEVPSADAMLEAAQTYVKTNGQKAFKAKLAEFAVAKMSDLDDEKKLPFLQSLEK
jgi:hypothetical protein